MFIVKVDFFQAGEESSQSMFTVYQNQKC